MSIYAQIDDIHVNVRLYPVQMLALGQEPATADRSKEVLKEINSVTISSPSGFQLKAHHERYGNKNLRKKVYNNPDYKEYDLINSQNGVVEKVYTIEQNGVRNISRLENKSNYMILTLISQ